MKDGVNYALCVANNPDLSDCEQSGQGSWYPPRRFVPPSRNISSQCTGYCQQNAPTTLTHAECDSTGYCAGNCPATATCDDAASCSSNSGLCTDWEGCMLPWNSVDICNPWQCYNGYWTP